MFEFKYLNFKVLILYWASLIAQLVKNLHAIQETLVPSLGRYLSEKQ